MEPLLRTLLGQAASKNGEEQNEAILQLALLLEKSAMKDKTSGGEPAIWPQLRALSLTGSDIPEIVASLGRLLESERRSSSMLWALGKAKSQDAAFTLLEFLKNHCQKLDEDAAWQALIALDNLLIHGEDAEMNAQLSSLTRDRHLTSCLAKISRKGNHDLSILAQRVSRKPDEKLN